MLLSLSMILSEACTAAWMTWFSGYVSWLLAVCKQVVDCGSQAVTNISGNFQKISQNIKFPENLQP